MGSRTGKHRGARAAGLAGYTGPQLALHGALQSQGSLRAV